MVPLLYVFLDGVRSTAEISANSTALPNPWVWSNYGTILTSAAFWEFLGNSALIATVATALAVGLGSMAAFALSRYVFRGREVFFTLFISGLLFPLQIAALPLFLQLQLMGLLDNQFGVALPEAAFSLPITILILRPFMRGIPGDLEDAAMVDGASRLRFFAQILLPMCKPALVTVALLAFVTSWNQFLLPLLVLQHAVALHPAARRLHVPVDVLVEHGLDPGVHRAGRGARPCRVPVGPALPGGRCVRRGQGVGLFPVRKNCSRDERNGVSDDSGSVRAVEGRPLFVRDMDCGVAGRTTCSAGRCARRCRLTGRSASSRSSARTA